MMKKITINWAILITVPIAIVLAVVGKVSWWILLIIFLLKLDISTTFTKR